MSYLIGNHQKLNNNYLLNHREYINSWIKGFTVSDY